jgi:hypothetical protein
LLHLDAGQEVRGDAEAIVDGIEREVQDLVLGQIVRRFAVAHHDEPLVLPGADLHGGGADSVQEVAVDRVNGFAYHAELIRGVLIGDGIARCQILFARDRAFNLIRADSRLFVGGCGCSNDQLAVRESP